MAWLKKKPDPITDRARVLTDEIAALEVEIQRLDAQLQRNQGQPRLRSTALPHGSTDLLPPAWGERPGFDVGSYRRVIEPRLVSSHSPSELKPSQW